MGNNVSKRPWVSLTLNNKLNSGTEYDKRIAPLYPPGGVSIAPDGIDAELVKLGVLNFMIGLREGLHEIPFTGGRPCSLEIRAGCEMSGVVHVKSIIGEYGSEAIIDEVRCELSHPLVFHNIFSTLREVSGLYNNHAYMALKKWILPSDIHNVPAKTSTDSNSTSRNLSLEFFANVEEHAREHLLQYIKDSGIEALDYLDRFLRIELSKITAKPYRHKGTWWLKFYFSGRVSLWNKLSIPFKDVNLPSAILAAPNASLRELMSEQPLASGELFADRIPLQKLVGVLIQTITDIFVDVKLSAYLPNLRAVLDTYDRGKLSAELELPEKVELRGSARGHNHNGVLSLHCTALELFSLGSKLTLDLDIKLDLDAFLHRLPAVLEDNIRNQIADHNLNLAFTSTQKDSVRDNPKLIAASLRVREGSSLEELPISLNWSHELLKGGVELYLKLCNGSLRGELEFALDQRGELLWAQKIALSLMGDVCLNQRSKFCDAINHWYPQLEDFGIEVTINQAEDQPLALSVISASSFVLSGISDFIDIPELSLHDTKVQSLLKGHCQFKGSVAISEDSYAGMKMDFRGNELQLSAQEALFKLDKYQFQLPTGTDITVAIEHGILDSSGLGELKASISWDMKGASPVISAAEQSAEIFAWPLRKKAMNFHISPSGELSFDGDVGDLYDSHYFNAILYPHKEPQKWLSILEDEEATHHIIATVRLFSESLADLIGEFRHKILQAKEILHREGVSEPRHVIPRANMARILSLILFNTDVESDELIPIIKQVTDGDGLDRHKLSGIIHKYFDEHKYEFEQHRLLRILDHLLSPAQPLSPPEVQEMIPLVEDEQYRDIRAKWPSAGEIYKVLNGTLEPSENFFAQVSEIAAYLTFAQIDYILKNNPTTWPSAALQRLRYIREIKERVQLIARAYGGMGFALQPIAISFFLGDIIGSTKDCAKTKVGAANTKQPEENTTDNPLGPEEVAILIQAGLAQINQGRTVQLNHRMLINYIAAQPKDFFFEVLIEISGESTLILTNVLFNLLNINQNYLRNPIDPIELFSEWLDIQLPHRRDYMAGGKWARNSYYNALYDTATQILSYANPYRARKQHLQIERHPIPIATINTASATDPHTEMADPTTTQITFTESADIPIHDTTSTTEQLILAAQSAISYADQLGNKCDFSAPSGECLSNARKAYQQAFAACSRVLQTDRYAFQQPWFKYFWSRNHEALMVLSVLRNYQEDIDQVRNWLHLHSGKSEFDNEQALLETIINTLYYFEHEKRLLLEDPLVRLCIDPKPDKYNFTIISCMGVITEGAKGRELEETYHRLKQKCGIEVIRADTGNVHILKYNGLRIEEAIRNAQTPYGIVGYSQGCTNALMAESMLRGGTPEQQALLDGLRCRNFLFSAKNGSAHGSCSNIKYLRTMEESEDFLKHFQIYFSTSIMDTFLTVLYQVLASPYVVQILGSVESLSHEGVIQLARDGQFLGHVPSSTVRGVVTPESLPEALEFLSNTITKQVKGALHDTQVTLVSAVGYPNRIISPYTALLRNCDMGSLPQTCHHWSPLRRETEMLATPRDKQLAIYDLPKDRHIFPWIEVNARFGII